jgi:hypothetical protein
MVLCHLSAASSPFSDGGDFYSCECGTEGYGHTDQDGYHLEFTIPTPTETTEKTKRRCPECGEELDYLECYTTAKYEYDGETFEYIEMADGWEEYGDYYFVCPKCKAEIALSIEEADEFFGKRKVAEEEQGKGAEKDE